MQEFIKGLELSECFFFDCAKPILDEHYPNLDYAAALVGYGSDVLGYDDEVSTDHMWGPRFYLFLNDFDIAAKDDIMNIFSEKLPYTYKGFSVNFTEPDEKDNGVRHPNYIDFGKVSPLIFITTAEEYLTEQLGTSDLDNISEIDWLTFSEHRLLSLVSGKVFSDSIGLSEKLSKLTFYPKNVKNYLVASNWDVIAAEQAFMRRAGDSGDDIGSRIICAKLAERLMRLCFLYKNTYAPYSKWFGKAFMGLEIDNGIKEAISQALCAETTQKREESLIKAQLLVAKLHNVSGITQPIECKAEEYYGRKIKVIFAEKFSNAVAEKLKGTCLEGVPLAGSLSQVGNLSVLADDVAYRKEIAALYKKT